MNTVKWDGIDRINMLDSFFLQPVALEGIFLLLNLLAWVQVLHSYTSLNWTQDISLEPRAKICKSVTSDSIMKKNYLSVFNRVFKVYLFVGEGSNAAGLILQTGLSSLLYIAHVSQIPHQDSSSSCANNQPISSHREGVHLWQRHKWWDEMETQHTLCQKSHNIP